MWARLRLDLSPADLLAGVLALGARDADRRAAELERTFAEDALACLSARSAFDLFLSAAALPRGSEVLLSALTIDDMARIVEFHGHVPIPLDIDSETLLPEPETLAAAIGPRTRACVVAHLFGARSDLDQLARVAHARDVLFVEDAAEAWDGTSWRGADASDLVLFSFGTIKTSTALGGALACVRDDDLRARMRALRDVQPVQTRGRHARRLAKGALLALASTRWPFGALARLAALVGADFDALLHGASRSFAGWSLRRAIRRRPCAPLLALLARRLEDAGTVARVARRAAFGKAFAAAIPESARVGALAEVRTHWVTPVRSRWPNELVRELSRAGYDATRRSSLVVVEPPLEREHAERVSELSRELVFVPVYPALGDARMREVAGLVRAASPDPEPIIA